MSVHARASHPRQMTRTTSVADEPDGHLPVADQDADPWTLEETSWQLIVLMLAPPPVAMLPGGQAACAWAFPPSGIGCDASFWLMERVGPVGPTGPVGPVGPVRPRLRLRFFESAATCSSPGPAGASISSSAGALVAWLRPESPSITVPMPATARTASRRPGVLSGPSASGSLWSDAMLLSCCAGCTDGSHDILTDDHATAGNGASW
jgi:hypothetical protein